MTSDSAIFDDAEPLDDHGLGRLAPVSPRDVWFSEPADFTPWLAGNLDVLFEQLGIDVGEVAEVQTEVAVGPFKLDILVATTTGRRIAVENQLETSDHSHLGQLLLYAAGLEADVLVWIATRFRPEYRAALDWLNSTTLPGVHAFGVELRVVRIGGSAPAPVFDVVSEPNDWEEVTKAQAQPNDTNRQRQSFYAQALGLLADRLTAFRMPKAQAESWQAFRSGPFGYYALVFTGSGQLRVEVYLDSAEPPDLGKRLFDELLADAEAIAQKVQGELVWERLSDKRASRIAVYRDAPDLEDRAATDSAAVWAADRAEELITALDTRLRKRAKELKQAPVVDTSEDSGPV